MKLNAKKFGKIFAKPAEPQTEPKFRSLPSCNTPLSLLSIALLPELGVPSVDLLVCVVLVLITVSFSVDLLVCVVLVLITVSFSVRACVFRTACSLKLHKFSKDLLMCVVHGPHSGKFVLL